MRKYLRACTELPDHTYSGKHQPTIKEAWDTAIEDAEVIDCILTLLLEAKLVINYDREL